ncbi:MAG: tRNA (adenosine(37)-N6)-threonylcarbamoyltransferase complex dimerization subunit type 1 TsaB [Myxococcaceae bacterium]|nr:tRNA (adenosine(37)-N6)-threonylcarbamoyltransferase complex dimerization subunit type 1 TsaB [Myxococcaceae bacterium]MBH2006324.1 tRNA (adenosine(37)-N6)-threonylcarbamoyltransferase complex dimerization subunit type 1 TsaB [Myxococcaceae bacterium]
MESVCLILDTSCPRALVALTQGNQILAEHYLSEYRRHGECLPAAVQTVLKEAGLPFEGIKQIAVGRGPGSFIGVRVAMAYAKGLAMALQIPLIGFGTLDAIEHSSAVGAAIDARRGEYYVRLNSHPRPMILKSLPAGIHLEAQGPSARGVVKHLSNDIEDETFTLVPDYIRDSQ